MREKYKNKSKKYEKQMLELYHCPAGKLSIGYGYNLEEGITPEIANFLFDYKWNASYKEAGSFKWFGFLNEPRQYVVVDMIYNMGLPVFRTFKKMIYHLSLGQYEYAAREMLNSKWAKQVGQRSKELASIMESGILED